MSNRNHSRKNAAKAYRAAHGGGHQEAVNAVRHDQQRPAFLVVDFPAPQLGGAAPCASCEGRGLGPDSYEKPTDDPHVMLLIETACPSCKGCGRADHADCQPAAHADDDLDEVDDYLAARVRPDSPERCPSCRGLGYNWHQAFSDDPEREQALADLMERARVQGMSEWDVQGAAAAGDLDEGLGDGSTAVVTGGSAYLRMPCGCQADRGRLVDRDELTADDPFEAWEEVPFAAGPPLGLLTIAMQIPELSMDLGESLDEHDGDVEQAAADAELLRHWSAAEPESRAGLLLNLAWAGRTEELPAGDDPAALYAEDLHTYAKEFSGDSEAFHGPQFPAMPLPGQAGALASSVGFDRDDLEVSLKAAVLLLAPIKQARLDDETHPA